LKLNIGDSVRFKNGTKDDDSNQDMSGWQGRVKEIREDDPVALVEFDSITIQEMPASYIKRCIEGGYSWTDYYEYIKQLDVVPVRDKPVHVANAISIRHNEFIDVFYMDEEERDIHKVLEGVDRNNKSLVLQTWYKHLSQELKFPFIAEVSEFQVRGPFQSGERLKVTGFDKTHKRYGVIVKVQHNRKKYRFPLSDVRVVNQSSPYYDPIELYKTWFANR